MSWSQRVRSVEPILDGVVENASMTNDLGVVFRLMAAAGETVLFDRVVGVLTRRPDAFDVVTSRGWCLGLGPGRFDPGSLLEKLYALPLHMSPQVVREATSAPGHGEPGGIISVPFSQYSLLVEPENATSVPEVVIEAAGRRYEASSMAMDSRHAGVFIPADVPSGLHQLRVRGRVEREVPVWMLRVDPTFITTTPQGIRFATVPHEQLYRDALGPDLMSAATPQLEALGLRAPSGRLILPLMASHEGAVEIPDDRVAAVRRIERTVPFAGMYRTTRRVSVELVESGLIRVRAGLSEGVCVAPPSAPGGTVHSLFNGLIVGGKHLELRVNGLSRALVHVGSREGGDAWRVPSDVQPGLHELVVGEGSDRVRVPYRIVPVAANLPVPEPVSYPGGAMHGTFNVERNFRSYPGPSLDASGRMDSVVCILVYLDETVHVIPARVQVTYPGGFTLLADMHPSWVGKTAWMMPIYRTDYGSAAAGEPWHGAIEQVGVALQEAPFWNSELRGETGRYFVVLHTNMPNASEYRMEILDGERVIVSSGPTRADPPGQSPAHRSVAEFRGDSPSAERVLARLVQVGDASSHTPWFPVYPRDPDRDVRAAEGIHHMELYDAVTRLLRSPQEDTVFETGGRRYRAVACHQWHGRGCVVYDDSELLVAGYWPDERYGGYREYGRGSACRPPARSDRNYLGHDDLPLLVATALRSEAGADFGLVPRSGVRGHLPRGPLHSLDLARALPYYDQIVVVVMTPDDLADAWRVAEEAGLVLETPLGARLDQPGLGLPTGRYSVAMPEYMVDGERLGGGRFQDRPLLAKLPLDVASAVHQHLMRLSAATAGR